LFLTLNYLPFTEITSLGARISSYSDSQMHRYQCEIFLIVGIVSQEHVNLSDIGF
jgi:hypothetical protein